MQRLEDETEWFIDDWGVYVWDGGIWYELINSCEYIKQTIN